MARRRKKTTVTNYGTSKRAKRPPTGTKAVDVKNAEVEIEGTSAKFVKRDRGRHRRAGEHGGVEGTSILKKLPPTLMDSVTGTMSGSQSEYFAEVFNMFPKTLMD